MYIFAHKIRKLVIINKEIRTEKINNRAVENLLSSRKTLFFIIETLFKDFYFSPSSL